jgi:hypothetical protein
MKRRVLSETTLCYCPEEHTLHGHRPEKLDSNVIIHCTYICLKKRDLPLCPGYART